MGMEMAMGSRANTQRPISEYATNWQKPLGFQPGQIKQVSDNEKNG